MTRRALCEFLVASCVPDGGVLRYRLYEDGQTELLQKIPMDRPMFMEAKNRVLSTVLRAPFEGSEESGVLRSSLSSGEPIGALLPTHGTVGCHIVSLADGLYVANYVSGSVTRLPDTTVSHQGSSVHPTRQTAPHAHGVFPSPDGRYLLVCDLGLDRILVYTPSLQFVSSERTPLGAGPRHLCFSACGRYVYCVNEMGGSVCSLAWENGALRLLETISLLPDGHVGDGAGAAIKRSRDGRFLYVTERATGTIVTLAANGAYLTPIASVDCAGKEPRDLTLAANERVALCANQFSDCLAIFRVAENGALTLWNTLSIPAPICILELPLT